MTVYFTQTPHMIHRPWARRWMEQNEHEQACEVFIPVDVKAEDDAYVLTAMIPGVSAEDLNIQVANDTVTIQGEIKSAEEKGDYLLRERPTGNFSRVLTLPDELDASKADADVANGVLTLRIPKAEDAKPKSIKVVAK
jgi:HSP20 family protein